MIVLLQDLVFGTDLFVGGPAEVAYYAQLGGLYERFGIRRPRVACAATHSLRRRRWCGRSTVRRPAETAFTSVGRSGRSIDPEPLTRLDRQARERSKSFPRVERLEQLILPADGSLERSIARSRRHLRITSPSSSSAAVRPRFAVMPLVSTH